ncbi:MAG: type II secretion system F family protein [Acidimicrobiia bacterium]
MNLFAAPAIGLGLALSAGLIRAARRMPVADRSRPLRPARPFLPNRIAVPLSIALTRAEIPVAPEVAVRWWALGVGVTAWLAMMAVPALVVPVVIAGLVTPPIGLRLRAHHADRAARVALPGVLDHVIAQLRAGGTVVESVRAGAARSGPLQSDFTRIDARLALGASLDDALARWVVERPVAGVRSVAGALAMASTMGGSAAMALDGVVRSLRDDDAAFGEALALSAQARVSAVVVGAAPLAYLVFATATDPASSRVLISTGPGLVCLLVGLTLEGLAALWMRALLGAAP